MISAADRLRVSPCWPVAQNGQAMPQPAWLEMQTVARSGIAHEHALDERAVVQPPQRLAGAPVVGGLVPDDGQQPRQQRLGERLAGGGRHVGHLRRVGHAAVEVPGELVGAEGRMAELGDRRAGLLAGEIGEVARAACPGGGRRRRAEGQSWRRPWSHLG